MCLYPRMIKNPKYRVNKKNGGIIPPILDERAIHVPIGCSKCMECRKQKARDWQIRLQEDIKHNTNGKFITLTFSNESIKKINADIPTVEIKGKYVEGEYVEKEIPIEGYRRDNAIAKRGLRLFLERWRKKYKRSLRHWLVTELGHNGTENIHMHGIVWTNEPMEEVERVWEYGYTWKHKIEKHKLTGQLIKVNYVSDRTVNYCVKYVSKIDEKHKTYQSEVLTSPGIGNGYTKNESGDWTKKKFKGEDTDETYRTRTGHKIAMPIYWRNKIYTDTEKEQLWLIKLNKEERWICGERIDISKSEQEYYRLLEFYRQKNTQLGYGDDKKNWSREKYEHERRKIMLNARLGYDYPIAWDEEQPSAYAASGNFQLHRGNSKDIGKAAPEGGATANSQQRSTWNRK